MICTSLNLPPRRFSNGSRITNIEPKLELFACWMNEMPLIAWVWAMPGVARVILSTCATTALVRSSEAESGSCTLMIMRPMSCCGTNPAGALAKTT